MGLEQAAHGLGKDLAFVPRAKSGAKKKSRGSTWIYGLDVAVLQKCLGC